VNDAVEIRPATRDDTEALLPLVRAYYAEESYPFDERASREALHGLLDDPAKGRAWVALCDGQVVGYVVLTLGWSLEYRGLGVKALHLEVEENKPEALALYRRLGFEDHERRLMTLAL